MIDIFQAMFRSSLKSSSVGNEKAVNKELSKHCQLHPVKSKTPRAKRKEKNGKRV